jgi:hypothetical protein
MPRASLPIANPLDYTGLPPASRLICEMSDDALRITLPPVAPLRVILGSCATGTCLVLCTIVLAWAIIATATDPLVSPADDPVASSEFFVALPLALLAFWAAAILTGRELWRRMRTPTSISIADDELVLITPNDLTLRRDWPAGAIERVEVRPAGRSITMSKLGELCVIPLGGRCVSVLRGEDFYELEWAARQLSHRLGIAQRGEERADHSSGS